MLHSIKPRFCYPPASSPFGQLFLRRRSSGLASGAAETVSIPCQSNGSINLSIHHPLLAPSPATTSPAVLIYLPRGPFLEDPEHDAANVSTLRTLLPCHVVQIHYRVSRNDQFPTPIHDVLAGYDWVHEHLLPKRAISRAGRSTHLGRVAVCGELIGGGLAAALALTECRRGQAGVVCAGLNNPIVDWVDLDELVDAKQTRKHSTYKSPTRLDTRGSMEELIHLRTWMFRKPELYFDPFASPLLFFRSTGKAVPPPISEKRTPQDEFEILAMLNEEEFHREQHGLSRMSNSSSSDPSPPPSNVDKLVPRRASRRFPGKSSGLKLPLFHVVAGEDFPIKDQGAELIYRLRQSFARLEKSSFGAKVLTDDEETMDMEEKKLQDQAHIRKLESMAEFTLHDGKALWDGTALGRARLTQMAYWLKDRLA